METLFYITGLGLGAGAAVGILRSVWRRQDAERRSRDRATYRRHQEEKRAEQARLSVAQLVDRFFPFVKDAWSHTNHEGEPRAALRRALTATDGVVLGRADIGFDAVLPTAARRQHSLHLGKTGFGKTSLSLHLIQDDFQRGRGLFTLSSEVELSRDWLLPLVPQARAHQVIYFKPSDPRCSLTWNMLSLEEGEDQALAAGQLFTIFKRAVGETTIGARADAILSNAFSVLVGRDGATLWSMIRLLEDEPYRSSIISQVDDPYLRGFWTTTFEGYPAGSVLPLINRLNQFLRLPQLRAALCHPISSFSLRDALARGDIVLCDLSGLDTDAVAILGQALLSKFSQELFRRERMPETERRPVMLHLDEFHTFATCAEGTWRDLLSRGRRYGLGLHLYTQHPGQVPSSLRQEIFGNVSSLVAFNLSAADAGTVRRELLVPDEAGALKPIPAEDFVSLRVGEGFARLGSGACALRVRFARPIQRPDAALGEIVREISWRTYAAPPLPKDAGFGPGSSPVEPAKNTIAPKSLPGRGGSQHKMLQQLTKEWAEAQGFRVTLEEPVLGGAGRVDVVLASDQTRVAVEIWLSGSTTEVTETIGKCIAAGFTHVIAVANDETARGRGERAVLAAIPARDKAKIRFLTPDGLRLFLEELSPPADQDRTAGYRLRLKAPQPDRLRQRRTLARLIGRALLGRRFHS